MVYKEEEEFRLECQARYLSLNEGEKLLLGAMLALGELPLSKEPSPRVLFYGDKEFSHAFAPILLPVFYQKAPLPLNPESLALSAEAFSVLERNHLAEKDQGDPALEVIFLEDKTFLPPLKNRGIVFSPVMVDLPSSYHLFLYQKAVFSQAYPFLKELLLLEKGFAAFERPFEEEETTFAEILNQMPEGKKRGLPFVYLAPLPIEKTKAFLFKEKEVAFRKKDDPLWLFFGARGAKREQVNQSLRARYGDQEDPLTRIAEYEHQQWILRTILFADYRPEKELFYRPFSKLVEDFEKEPSRGKDKIRYDYYAYLILEA
jgi:hypothetical protein